MQIFVQLNIILQAEYLTRLLQAGLITTVVNVLKHVTAKYQFLLSNLKESCSVVLHISRSIAYREKLKNATLRCPNPPFSGLLIAVKMQGTFVSWKLMNWIMTVK